MIFYHGSKSLITEFNKKGNGKHGYGGYFTPDKNEAIYFAKSLLGDGTKGKGFLYQVDITIINSFNSMSIEHCQIVSSNFGFKYKVPEFAGGQKEHYHHLLSQMKKRGIIENESLFNDLIKDSGFDSVLYELMGHIIVFDLKNVSIVSKDDL